MLIVNERASERASRGGAEGLSHVSRKGTVGPTAFRMNVYLLNFVFVFVCMYVHSRLNVISLATYLLPCKDNYQLESDFSRGPNTSMVEMLDWRRVSQVGRLCRYWSG